MTRDEYLQWIQRVTHELARSKYPNNREQQLLFQLGLTQRALADLCYIDSDNTNKVNRMLKRNIKNF